MNELAEIFLGLAVFVAGIGFIGCVVIALPHWWGIMTVIATAVVIVAFLGAMASGV